MDKAAHCIIKVALLLDNSDEVTGLDLGVGAGALGLLGGGLIGGVLGGVPGVTAGGVLGGMYDDMINEEIS